MSSAVTLCLFRRDQRLETQSLQTVHRMHPDLDLSRAARTAH